MVHLKVYRSLEEITFSTIDNEGRLGELTELGRVAYAYVNIARKEIGLNLDMFKNYYSKWLLVQTMSHEILHYLFPNWEATRILHKIHNRTNGLIL